MKRYLFFLVTLVLMVGMGCEQQNPTTPESSASPGSAAKFAGGQRIDRAAIKAKLETVQARLATLRAAHNAKPVTKRAQNETGAAGIEATLVVPDVYATIQDAVDAALPGDQITVKASGSPYTESVFVSTADLKIVASGEVTLLGYFDVSASGVSIEKFIIDAAVEGIGISAGSEISGGKIKNNTIGGDFVALAGIYMIDCANFAVEGNTCSRSVFGIYLLIDDIDPPYSNLIKKNRCRENEYGIEVDNASGNQLIENTCNLNFVAGIYLSDSHNNELQKNVCNNNVGTGFCVGVGGSSGNIIRPDNTAKNNGDHGIILDASSFNNKVKENTFTGNTPCDILDEGTGNVFRNNTFDCSSLAAAKLAENSGVKP